MPKLPFETNGALRASNPIAGVVTASVTNVPKSEFDTVTAADTTESDTAPQDTETKSETSATKNALPNRQTHGASFIRGPVTSVQQLIGLRNAAKGSMGSFETMAAYSEYVEGLTLGDLHAHAVQSNVVPIDDRNRLIRRLETEWTTVASRAPGRGAGISRPLASADQNQRAREILEKTLKRQR
jgi:hypothetical protein